ncbi:hypothetical protein HDV01_007876 [Terramyces sp. JEL0728]|nr:hypothetical protein HDV01_007876 [Terramyces sp. JEL0728]
MNPRDLTFAYDPKFKIIGKHLANQIYFVLSGQMVTLEMERQLSPNSTSVLHFRDRTCGIATYDYGRRVLVEYMDSQFCMIDFNYADHPINAYVGCTAQTKNYIPQYVLAGERLWNYQYSEYE